MSIAVIQIQHWEQATTTRIDVWEISENVGCGWWFWEKKIVGMYGHVTLGFIKEIASTERR
jgi:hypothetical protein